MVSKNYPNYAVGIKSGNQAWIVDNAYARFRMVSPGLTGEAGTVSFESKDKPGYFLRHQNFLMFLHPRDNSDLFKKDATFVEEHDKFFTVSLAPLHLVYFLRFNFHT